MNGERSKPIPADGTGEGKGEERRGGGPRWLPGLSRGSGAQAGAARPGTRGAAALRAQPAQPQAGASTSAGGFRPLGVSKPPGAACADRGARPTPGTEGPRDPWPGSRSAQRPRGRARPVPVPPTRAVPRWDSVAFYFSFKWNKLKPRSGAGPAEPRPPGPCRGAAPPLTPFCGGNLEGFSKACFSYFFVVVVVVQLALVIYSMHA